MTIIEKTNKPLKIEQGNLFATIHPQQGERVMVIGGSDILTARCSDAGASVWPVISFNQVQQDEFDTVAAPLSIHSYADGAQWASKAYDALKKDGRFVADFAEAESLPSAVDFPYAESLAGYWERLKAAGFSTILFQQLSVTSAKEAVLNGWTELVSSKYPVKVNRFIAVK
ncbi:hypothetical protein [Domibacillus enclensis]|uniref:Methyltransferase domain-containing protein n=1 Tax=Domibacillus enclensis TaxID=1017273 RepID=A0A1N6WR90_9BACI|nr:hypothetical protein [Domibacillus enclensis]OXS78011.1 hypothetical protein B1B05_10440 [Domibacillus enclensis]SIQ92551.1 hypothetical protein SAMN05443094_104253 [Domibacillus enclensis]